MSRRGRQLVLGALVAVALLGLAAACTLAAIHARGLGAADDAFISFRMARNLAQGHGLRFNPGGQPVEAASNFLLTVMLAGAHLLGLSLIQSSAVIAMVATALTLLLLAWTVWRRAGPWGVLAPAGLATMSIVAGNATNGLETSLFTFLLLLAVVVYVAADGGPRPRRRLLALSSMLFALVALTRPEGPMYMVALGLLRLLDLVRRRRRGQPLDLRTELWWAGGFIVLYLPYTVWRLAYFGMLLPNTYHAKEMQFIEISKLQAGGLYLRLMALREPLLPIALVLGGAVQLIAPDRRLRTLLAICVTQSLFMVLSGGDWPHMFGFGRFLMPAIPLLLWMVAEAGLRLIKLRRRLAAAVAVVAIVGLSQADLVGRSAGLPVHYHTGARAAPTLEALRVTYLTELPALPRHEWWRRSTQTFTLDRYHYNFDAVVGLWLRQRYGPDVPIASIQAGQFAFWSGMPFFDMFGLVSPEVTRLGSADPRALAETMLRFNPSLIAFYKWSAGVHHRGLVLDGFLRRAGYGLRYVFLRRPHRAFVIFEKGYPAEEDGQSVLFSSIEDLPLRVDRDRLIAALDPNHPRL